MEIFRHVLVYMEIETSSLALELCSQNHELEMLCCSSFGANTTHMEWFCFLFDQILHEREEDMGLPVVEEATHLRPMRCRPSISEITNTIIRCDVEY